MEWECALDSERVGEEFQVSNCHSEQGNYFGVETTSNNISEAANDSFPRQIMACDSVQTYSFCFFLLTWRIYWGGWLWEYGGLGQWIGASLRGVSLYAGISLPVTGYFN